MRMRSKKMKTMFREETADESNRNWVEDVMNFAVKIRVRKCNGGLAA